MSREIAIIVAYDRRRAIGNAGGLPWHLPDDLRHFKALTLGQRVLMGRRTFEAIGRPLPGRENWVLSRDPSWSHPGAETLRDWRAALDRHHLGTLWVIGGGEIYRLALPDADRIEATEVEAAVPAADAWFPKIDENGWEVAARAHHAADAHHAYAFDFVSRVRRHQCGDPQAR